MKPPLHLFSPGTIGNVGPGFDTLGLCLNDMGDFYRFEFTGNDITIGDVTGRDAELIPRSPMKNAVSLAFSHYLKLSKKKLGVRISIHRQLPLSGGLGGSASASVAGSFAAMKMLGESENFPFLIDSALTGEGKVSGYHLDNIAPAVLGGLSLVQNLAPPKILKLGNLPNTWVVLIQSEKKLPTKDSRSALPLSSPQKIWTKQMANSLGLVHGLQTRNEELIRNSFRDHFAEPVRAPFIPQFKELKNAALDMGALGLTISGGGPTLFSLSLKKDLAIKIANRLKEMVTHPSQVIVDKVGSQGVRILDEKDLPHEWKK
jgi:homoserine kinase